VVHSGYLRYPAEWLVWRIGLALKWVSKEVKLINIIVSGDLQEQLQCLKLCEYLCVSVCVCMWIFVCVCVRTCIYSIDMKLFRDSTRDIDGAELRLLGRMLFCNFDGRHFCRRHVMMVFSSCLVLILLSCYCEEETLHCSIRFIFTLNLIYNLHKLCIFYPKRYSVLNDSYFKEFMYWFAAVVFMPLVIIVINSALFTVNCFGAAFWECCRQFVNGFLN